MAADVMVSTPTAAANLLNESWSRAILILERFEREIFNRYGAIIKKYQEVENKINLSLQNFRNNITSLRVKLDGLAEKYSSGFNHLLLIMNERIKNIEKIIKINNPERQLKLGYSISKINGKIVRSIKDAKVGEDLETKFSDGKISSEIKNIN